MGKTHQTWGYHPTQEARIFELAEGETLPEGWADVPVPMDVSEIDDEPSDGSDWEKLYVAADLRAKALEIETASLKEELSALLEQMSAAPMDDPELAIPQRGAEPEPEHWSKLHHSTRIRMAKEIAPDLAELITNAKEADEILAKHEADLNG